MSGRGSTVALAGLVFLFSLTGKTTRRGDGGGLGWATGGRNVRFAELQTRRMQGGLAGARDCDAGVRAVCIAAAGAVRYLPFKTTVRCCFVKRAALVGSRNVVAGS